jgi:hypothetical protein
MMKQSDNAFNIASEKTDNDAEQLYTIRREIHRKLGQNILLIQQYERLIKVLITDSEISGSIDEWADIKARRIEKNAKKTLGQTTGEFIDDYLIPSPKQLEDDCLPESPDKFHMSMRFSVFLGENRHEEIKGKMSEVVLLRSRLIHHFFDDHDIKTEKGCLLADAHLEGCHKKIDNLYREFHEIAKARIEGAKLMAAFFQSPELMDFLWHGIIPGGGWPSSTIVTQLKKAETALAKDGWTLLQDAIEYIRRNAPEHTPKRYGCSSWRQVLHESKQFEIRKEQMTPELTTTTFYCNRC